VLAYVEKRGELGWVVGCSLGGERWDGEEKGEIEEERVLAKWVYTCIYQRHHRRNISVGDSAGVSDTSLIDYLGLNPLVFLSVNSSEKHPCHDVVATFKKSFSPSVYTDGIADGLFPSANTDSFWDGISSVVKNYRRKISVDNFVGIIRFSGSVFS